jgi:hypothetical protein
MDAKERAQTLAWIAAWRSAGEALDEERRQRLRSMTPAQRREAIHIVLAAIPEDAWGTASPECGLVAMQQLFARARP